LLWINNFSSNIFIQSKHHSNILKENIVKLFPILAILQSSSGEDFYKKTTDYDQEKKSQLSLGTEIYTSDSATRTLQKEKGGHLQLVPIPSKRVVGAERWR